MKFDTKKRRLVFRALLVLVWLSALSALFAAGRGHTLLVDNIPVDDLPALPNVKVSINAQSGAKPVVFMAGDRVRFFVRGTKLRVKIEAEGSAAANLDLRLPFEAVLPLPLRPDVFILSLPRLLAGKQPLDVFVSTPPPTTEDEPVLD